MGRDKESGNLLGCSIIRLLIAEAVIQGCHFEDRQFDDVNPRIHDALNRMQTGFADPSLTVEGLAWQAKMSEAGFRLRFKQSVGQSPKAYLTSLRMQRATRLLVETEISIARIAAQVGFASPQHFHAVFRSQLNCTPATYRKKRVMGL